ncbi:MAG: NnrU family protein [Burkholderiaceae bacterium]
MLILILGLAIFLGVHSLRIVADAWRGQLIARHGEGVWKGAFSLLSLLGLGLIVWGYGLARQQPIVLWVPPQGMRHAAALLTLVSFVLLAATYVPGNRIKARLKHPMVLAVKVWAVAHLLANGNLADVLLFGSFLLWAALSFQAARQRDRTLQIQYPPGRLGPTLVTALVGSAAWLAFALWLHLLLVGVSPLRQ